MSKLKQHTVESAPTASRAILEGAQKGLGFVPNLYATFAESPAALNAYVAIGAALDKHSSLSAVERNLVAIAISRENSCDYCVAAHSTLAESVGIEEGALNGVRAGTRLGDAKLEALRQFSIAVTDKRGWVSREDLENFYRAGYEPQHLLEVITLAALKTLSNYTNHIASTPLDDAFRPQAWSRDT